MLGKLPVPGRPVVRQGPAALAVGAGGCSLDIFAPVYHFSSFSLSGIWTEILSQGPLDPKQPTKYCLISYFSYNTKRSAGVCKAKIA